MDSTNVPIGKAIPLAQFQTFEGRLDWDMYYGRWGTEELIYADYYGGCGIPEHLVGKVTHVWMYHEK